MSIRSTTRLLLTLVALTPLFAGDPPTTALKWRGSLWALGTLTDRPIGDGSAFLRFLETGDSQFSLDGIQLGLDYALSPELSFKATLLAGREGKLLQDFSGEHGSMGFPEAMLIWTRGADTVKIGRMWTAMGMESVDLTVAIPASHGLMATFPLPYGQVGLEWRHAWSPSWATSIWVYNGEDRNTDNNRGKTFGLGLSYNHGGAADKFMNFMAFSGPEQDSHAPSAIPGAEGRNRDRFSHSGQWVWGAATLVWEAEYLREPFSAVAIQDATTQETGIFTGAGAVFKYQWSQAWSGYARAEHVKDNLGFRLSFDSTVATHFGMRRGAELAASSIALGAERRWGPAFARLEFRRDWLNRDVLDRDGKAFRSVNGVTVCVGASFGQ